MRLLALPLAALLSGCTLALPFRAPEGAHRPAPGDTVVVSLTHATVKAGREARRSFDRYTDIVVDSLPKQPGLVGFSLRRTIMGDKVWTMTVWKDEEARAAFVASEPHRAAMANALQSLETVRFARKQVAADRAPPRWNEALRWLEESGRGYGR